MPRRLRHRNRPSRRCRRLRHPEVQAAASSPDRYRRAFPLEGRDIRLIRVGEQDIALQFELFNGTKQTVQPYDLGIGLIERDFKLWT